MPETEDALLSRPTFQWPDLMLLDGRNQAVPFSGIVVVKRNCYHVKVSFDDRSLRTRRLDVALGRVALSYRGLDGRRSVVIQGVGGLLEGAFFAVGKKSVSVPAGRYRVAYGTSEKGDSDCLLLCGSTAEILVEPNRETSIELGSPFTLDFEVERRDATSLVVKGRSVVVRGRAGEEYVRFSEHPVIPDHVVVRCISDATIAERTYGMRGATLTDYELDPHSLPMPRDLVIPIEEGQHYEVQLRLTDHPLFAEVLQSDWKRG